MPTPFSRSGIKRSEIQAQLERIVTTLWNPEPPRTRGPKRAFTRDEVVATAISIADARGIDAVSMRSLADQLGLGTMSLYRYVPGKEELVALMLERAYGETTPASELPGDWRAKLESSAHQQWALFHRHPWMLDLPLDRVSPGPLSMERYDAALAVVLSTGLPPDAAVAINEAIEYVVRGAARASIENISFIEETGLTIEQWWEHQGPSMLAVMDPARFPALQEVLNAGAFSDRPQSNSFEVAFLDTLATFLDGVAVRLDRHLSGQD
ncbi:TetR/AcrR family transcriptional regulator [Hoyosella sp. YIM 151337]|uniref:TetR/AcrR family transcriptional regulator n=1 Tax=Hoyosella sp. YIM 151337 TaxID=2992742 RepID=UPI00223668FE|nr:TetR/AcrR family transcriptional regulator [Hoyosella sp. YIM 151337]MCW4356044.1 TetR/AcrR family transcriptional regulator [Hoyosella sp. YIM 151337]